MRARWRPGGSSSPAPVASSATTSSSRFPARSRTAGLARGRPHGQARRQACYGRRRRAAGSPRRHEARGRSRRCLRPEAAGRHPRRRVHERRRLRAATLTGRSVSTRSVHATSRKRPADTARIWSWSPPTTSSRAPPRGPTLSGTRPGLSRFTAARSSGAEHEAGPEATIVRTSWLSGPTERTSCQDFSSSSDSDGPLRFVDDQRGRPTFTRRSGRGHPDARRFEAGRRVPRDQ